MPGVDNSNQPEKVPIHHRVFIYFSPIAAFSFSAGYSFVWYSHSVKAYDLSQGGEDCWRYSGDILGEPHNT